MKVYIENLKPNMSPYNGKGKFVQRLAKEMRKQGVEIVDTPETCDINFRMNVMPSTDYGKKVVRLDNAAYSNEVIHRTKGNNKGIEDALKRADLIVFQSKIAFNQVRGIYPFRVCSEVIPSGVDRAEFKTNYLQLAGASNFLIAHQIIHPMRRIKQVFEVWNKFATRYDAHLYFAFAKMMDGIDFGGVKNLHMLDVMEQPVLNDYMRSVNAVINLTYMDSCPNMIIEATACGTPSILSETSGILDFATNFTFSVGDSSPVNRIVKWKTPPRFRGIDLYRSLYSAHNNMWPSVITDMGFPKVFDISNVADKYINAFKRLIV